MSAKFVHLLFTFGNKENYKSIIASDSLMTSLLVKLRGNVCSGGGLSDISQMDGFI